MMVRAQVHETSGAADRIPLAALVVADLGRGSDEKCAEPAAERSVVRVDGHDALRVEGAVEDALGRQIENEVTAEALAQQLGQAQVGSPGQRARGLGRARWVCRRPEAEEDLANKLEGPLLLF